MTAQHAPAVRRQVLKDFVSTELGKTDSKLIWLGTRGDDVLSITDLPELVASFSLISSIEEVPGIAVEDILGRRFDLDTYDVDAEQGTDAVVAFKDEILRTLSLHPGAAIVEYRSTYLGWSAAQVRGGRHLGQFPGLQSSFEFKPWVEAEVAQLVDSSGAPLPRVEWFYVPEIDFEQAARMLDDGPMMVRASRGSGGTGLHRVTTRDELETHWPHERERFACLSRFIEDAIPLNIGAVVWEDGVTLHPLSVQIIGDPRLTSREFGYCGNDFEIAKALPEHVVAAIETITTTIGNWLRLRGYRGAFGVDFLTKD